MRNQSMTISRSRTAWWAQYPALAGADLVTSRVAYWVALGAILAIALVLRVWDLNATDLWTDEIHTLRRIQLPLGESIDTILYAGNQTPLYYLLLRMFPGDGIGFVRGLAVGCGMLNVVMLSEIVVRLYHNRALGLALAALLAVNPMHIVLSRTARFYTLLMAISMVAIVCFILLARGRRSNRLWIVFMVSSGLLYLLHYTGLALPATQLMLLVFGFKRYRDVLARWIPVQIAAVLPLLVWYGVLVLYWFTPYLGGLRAFSYDYLGQTVHLKDGVISVLYLLVGFDGRWDWLLLPGMIVAAAGVIAGGRDAISAWREGDASRSYWALLTVTTIVVLVLMAVLTGAQYRDRYYMIVLASLFMMFGLGVARWPQPVALGALAIVVLTSGYASWQVFRSGEYERTDWTGVGAYIDAQYQPGDAVLVGRELLYDAFAEHFDGDPAVLESFVLLEDYVGSSTREQIMAVEPQAARVWVIYRYRHEELHRQGWEYAEPLTPNLSPESDWLIARQNRIVDRKDFTSVIVFLLDGPAP